MAGVDLVEGVPVQFRWENGIRQSIRTRRRANLLVPTRAMLALF